MIEKYFRRISKYINDNLADEIYEQCLIEMDISPILLSILEIKTEYINLTRATTKRNCVKLCNDYYLIWSTRENAIHIYNCYFALKTKILNTLKEI
jgi:hypothetical protein